MHERQRVTILNPFFESPQLITKRPYIVLIKTILKRDICVKSYTVLCRETKL